MRIAATGARVIGASTEALLVALLILALIASYVAVTGTGPLAHASVNTDVATGHAVGEILVRYRAGADITAERRAEASAGASRVRSIDAINVRVLSVPAGIETAAAATIARNPSVEFAERNPLVVATATPNDPWWAERVGPGQGSGAAGMGPHDGFDLSRRCRP